MTELEKGQKADQRPKNICGLGMEIMEEGIRLRKLAGEMSEIQVYLKSFPKTQKPVL